jgi:hypothetical protein
VQAMARSFCIATSLVSLEAQGYTACVFGVRLVSARTKATRKNFSQFFYIPREAKPFDVAKTFAHPLRQQPASRQANVIESLCLSRWLAT